MGQATDIMIHDEEIVEVKHLINKIYVKHTGQTAEEIEKLLEHDQFFDAESAQHLGLIDKVLEHPILDLINQDEKPHQTNN